MSLWSTLPAEEQLLTEPADEAGLALAADEDERADLAAYRRARRQARTRRLGTGALGLAVLVLLWQLIAMLINDPVFLPSVSQTAASFAHYFGRPYPAQGKPLWYDALTSLRRILIGFHPARDRPGHRGAQAAAAARVHPAVHHLARHRRDA